MTALREAQLGQQPTPEEAAKSLRHYARKRHLPPGDNIFEDAAVIIDRLRASPAPDRVSVKPLHWPDEIKQGQRVKSSGGLVNYTIAHYGGSEPDSGVVFRWAAEGEKWSAHPFFAYEHAITAAQADYEKRILSALSEASK